MAVIVHHFYSAALTECNSMTVIVPVEEAPREAYPVLWLIPPFGCDHTAWLRHTDLERLAGQHATMIVMPDMKLSFGMDMVHGLKYHTMLTRELPQVLAQVYPADLTRQMIAGAEEGAFTALYSSLVCEGQYQHTIALSGGSLVDEVLPTELQRPFSYASGEANGPALAGSCYDICAQLKNGRNTDGWQLAWSAGDKYHHSCERLALCLPAGKARQCELPVLGWREWEGILEDILQTAKA